MINVNVNGDTRRASSPGFAEWLTREVDRRRQENVPTCVRLSIELDMVNVALATCDCAGGGGGGRAPNSKERDILELWERCGLSHAHFAAANLLEFLKRIGC
jgi:hypothetical protein